MYLHKGEVYVSFGGDRVRLTAVFVDNEDLVKKVRVAILVLPGGTKVMNAEHFENEYAREVSEERKENILEAEKPKTALKYKVQKHNPYAR